MELCDKVKQHLLDITVLDEELDAMLNQMKEQLSQYLKIFQNDSEINTITKAFQNILANSNPPQTPEELILFKNDCLNVFTAVKIFTHAMIQHTNEESLTIERKLFNMAFISCDDLTTKILPVYFLRDDFLNTKSSCINFKSSTGSGKTRCAPFFFSLKAIEDDLQRPFFIMTQPSKSNITDKINDFTQLLGDSVIFVTDIKVLESMYKEFPKKPVIALFTPLNLVKILSNANQLNFPLEKYSRFVLDEVHERTVETDILVALMEKKINEYSIPLHLLMMSATPDPRILESFKSVNEIELPNTQLFNITDIPKVVKNYKKLDKTIIDTTIDIVKKMENEQLNPGHILIFSSGNKRITNLMSKISTDIKSLQNRTKVCLIEKLDKYLNNQKIFYDHLDDYLLKDPESKDKLYILVLKYARFVGSEARQIAKDPIRGHSNVIKIIITTNALESSVTIDNLAAVIDSGICNIPTYDRIKGITILEEGPISKQNQIQRRGRVGRKREGICVQITIKDLPPIELLRPSIEIDDISSNILGFRKMNIYLEDIDNLPKPGISPEMMNKYIDELTRIGAIDSDKKITEIGSHLAAFTLMSPFISSSILKVADKYEDKSIASIAGALVFHVFSTNRLFSDPMSDSFRRNFCEDSDIITLMNTLLEVMNDSNGKTKIRLAEYGFDANSGLKVIACIERIASNVYDEEKKTLWNDLNEFCKSIDMMTFIQDIITEIENAFPSFVSCRRAEFISVSNVMDNCFYFYKGSKTLDNAENDSKIRQRMRPGGKGFISPGACFIMQIRHNVQMGEIYFGSIIHRDLSRKEICHPTSIEAPKALNNIYTVPLIEGYIGDLKNKFLLLPKSYESNDGLICFPDQYGDKATISFIPKDCDNNEAIELMKEAIEKVSKLLPYTPRTVLVQNDAIKAIVAVTSFGINNYTTRIINYTDELPIPYKLDKTLINHLIDHVDELNDVDARLTIAITGEKFFYSSYNEEEFDGNPICSLEMPCVFSVYNKYYSHLVVLSDENLSKGAKLNWVDKKISMTYSEADTNIQVANSIFRCAVEVKHKFDMIYFMNQFSNLIVDTEDEAIKSTLSAYKEDNEKYENQINKMFDKYMINNTKDSLLVKNIDLKGFYFSSPVNSEKLQNDFNLYSNFKLKYPNKDINRIIDDIPVSPKLKALKMDDMINRRNIINDDVNRMKAELSQLSNDESNNKKRKELESDIEYFSKRIDTLNADINSVHDEIKKFAEKNEIDEETSKSLFFMSTPKTLLELPCVNIKENQIEVKTNVDARDEVIKAFNGYQSELAYEVVPLTSIYIYHRQNSNLTSKQFISKIDEICSKYGKIIIDKKYCDTPKKRQTSKGVVKVLLFSSEIAIPFVTEVRYAIGKGDQRYLHFPSKIVPPCLINRHDVIESINQWIRKYKLNIKRVKSKYVGTTQEISKVNKLLLDKDTQPNICYKCISIPGGIEISKVDALIGPEWVFDKPSRLVYIPQNAESKTIDNFNEKIKAMKVTTNNEDDSEIAYDYMFCCESEATLSGYQMPFYQRDGTTKFHNYCVFCAYEGIRSVLDTLFDSQNDRPRLHLLIENIAKVNVVALLQETSSDAWPSIPLGQLLWCLISEPTMYSLTKTWFSAIVYQALHSCQLFTYCCDHPSILLRRRKNFMKCILHDCKMFYCDGCMNWHGPGGCKNTFILPPGLRLCPACKQSIEKSEKCNHIQCQCGMHFCYYCGYGPKNNKHDIYTHMNEEHNGSFNDPPDYLKYVKKMDVDQKDLDEFYKKYPQFLPV